MQEFSLDLPVNKLSFGNCSMNILFELFEMGLNPSIFLVGGQADLGCFESAVSKDFIEWFKYCYSTSQVRHKRSNPTFKLWHLNGSLNSYSRDQYLFTFYELDSPTESEINISNSQSKVFVSSSYTKQIFENVGCNNYIHCPLGFDSRSFFRKETNGKNEKIVFGLAGKLERRKQHHKVLKAWANKYGNNPKYLLNCAISNPFFSKEQQVASLNSVLENKNYFNINFLDFMDSNSTYNDYLNSNDIIIGMSSAEGWGLPEFQSTAIGKHAVILNAHAYKDWATAENSVLVNPSSKVPAYDGIFFNQGAEFNQGSYFDWNEDEFISACEQAEKRFNSNPVNENGLNLQKDFTWKKTTSLILETMSVK